MKGRRIAFLIGNDHFPCADTIAELKFPKNDVRAMSELLGSEKHGRFDEVVTLLNRDSQQILENLESGLSDLGADDLVVIYYAGHGILTRTGKLCLATKNSDRQKIRSTSVPVDLIRDYVTETYARQRIVILDCCYSGSAEDAWLRSDLESALIVTAQNAGLYLLTATTKHAAAVEKSGHGVLTKHLIEGVRSGGADTNNRGWVSMDDVYKYVVENVPAEATQMPMRAAFGTRGNLCFSFTQKKAGKDSDSQATSLLIKLQLHLTQYLDVATDLCTVWSQDTFTIVHYPEAIKRINDINQLYYEVTNNLWKVLPTLESDIEEQFGSDSQERYVQLYKKIRFCHTDKAKAINKYQKLLLPIPEKTPVDDPSMLEAERVRESVVGDFNAYLLSLKQDIEFFMDDLRNIPVEL